MQPRSSRLALSAVLASAAAIVLLSLVPAWFVHVRHIGGHGLTAITVAWSGWEGRAVPFAPAAVVAATLVAILALANRLRPGLVPALAVLGGALLVLALLLGSLVPLDRLGYASRVVIRPAWALAAASVAGLVLVAGAGHERGAWRTRRSWLAVALTASALSAATFGGRVVALNLAEGNPRHWSDGGYERPAGAGAPSEQLEIAHGTYRIGDRWSGSIEGRGLVAVLTADPACPDARGAYRVFDAGDGDLRWELIVDLCADGERAADLTTGTWQRRP